MRLLSRFLSMALVALALPLAFGTSGALPADPVRDHAMVKRFTGSRVLKSSVRGYDEYWIPTAKLIGDGQAEKFEVLEGKWTHFTYSNPAGKSVLEIVRSYERALTTAGFDTMYSCKDQDCGEGGRKTNGDWWSTAHLHRFMVARLARPQGDVWVSVHVHAKDARTPGQHEVDIVETKVASKPVVEETNELDPESLSKALARSGRVPLYAISFEPGKAQLMPESSPALEAIAGLLEKQPDLRLHLVVHTDNEGGVSANVQLSRKRAATLVHALAKGHGVSPKRIRAEGVGPLSPIAPNGTDEERAKNRRVELIALAPLQ